MKLRLKSLKNDKAGYLYPITNSQYNQILNKLKNKNIDIEDIYKINNIHNIIRSEFIAKKLKLSLPIKTLAFVNIQKPEKDEKSKDFNNKTRLEEVKILQKLNPENYKAYIFENKNHYIFNKKQPAKEIIKKIKNIL